MSRFGIVSSLFLLHLFPSQSERGHQSSVNRSNKLILKIMINNPIVTTISNANPNQPSTIAVVPTPLLTLPFPKSCAIVLAATEAVCCHSTETSTKTEAMKMSARATWDTEREGKGLTSRSEPRSSTSSCQPGKVRRRRKQTKARTMATILFLSLVSSLLTPIDKEGNNLHKIRKNNGILKRTRYPYQIQWILIHANLIRQTTGIITA